jgi:hypothetical protein
MQFILQSYQGKKEVIKSNDDYIEQMSKIKAFNVSKIPKRRSFKNDNLLYQQEYSGLTEALPYLKGCFDIIDSKCENKAEFIRTEHHCELRLETSVYKVIITKLDFYNREKVEIYKI